MNKNSPVAIVMGIMARSPYAGVALQGLHYLEGLRRLGCDVYYVEDTGDWPYDADQNTVTDDVRYPTKYLSRLMEWCELSGKWCYRSGADGEYYGITKENTLNLFKTADVLINVTGATILREEHLHVPVRIYLETDPFLPQVEVALGNEKTIDILNAHTHLFTFGENLGGEDCQIPIGLFEYQATRQPIIMDWWQRIPTQSADKISQENYSYYSTITSWEQKDKDIGWKGSTYYWSKHLEFMKIVCLPLRSKYSFELALASDDSEVIKMLKSNGWNIVDAIEVSKDIEPYRNYIANSRGEFTVAKDQYVRPRSGWFSDRSACYLAAGRPVITQETGFGKILPTNKGLFAWENLDDILNAIEQIEADYEGNSRAATEIANEYFNAEKVIGKILAQIGIPV